MAFLKPCCLHESFHINHFRLSTKTTKSESVYKTEINHNLVRKLKCSGSLSSGKGRLPHRSMQPCLLPSASDLCPATVRGERVLQAPAPFLNRKTASLLGATSSARSKSRTSGRPILAPSSRRGRQRSTGRCKDHPRYLRRIQSPRTMPNGGRDGCASALRARRGGRSLRVFPENPLSLKSR